MDKDLSLYSYFMAKDPKLFYRHVLNFLFTRTSRNQKELQDRGFQWRQCKPAGLSGERVRNRVP